MHAASIEYLSIQQAAALKGTSTRAIYDILSSAARRARIFPRAQKVGDGRRGVWLLHPQDVESWTPRAYPR